MEVLPQFNVFCLQTDKFPFLNCRNDEVLPVNHVGLINYLTVGWLSKVMWKAMKVSSFPFLSSWLDYLKFKTGLTNEDILPLSGEDDARRNAERMQRIWDEEVLAAKLTRKNNSDDEAKPSLSRVVWRFGRTRFLIAICLVFISEILQFVGPVSILAKIIIRNKYK